MTTANKKAKCSFRLRVKDTMGNVSFLYRNGNNVHYCSGSETPLALSNLAGSKACELRFALQDARSDQDAAAAVRKFGEYAKEVAVI
jgi:hypothetical protein